MENLERYVSYNVTDFEQRKNAMQMFFDLDPTTRRAFVRIWLGESMLRFTDPGDEDARRTLRRQLMIRLASKEGSELHDRIRLAYLRESRGQSWYLGDFLNDKPGS